jgi:hypothetical protein
MEDINILRDKCIKSVKESISNEPQLVSDDEIKKLYCTCFTKVPLTLKIRSILGLNSAREKVQRSVKNLRRRYNYFYNYILIMLSI